MKGFNHGFNRMISPEVRHSTILLAEDDPADIALVRQVTKESKIINELNVVNDGEELLEYLRKQGKFHDAPTPDLILLDLNMPKVGGPEALAEIKADPLLRRIPVVVMTSSLNEEDVIKSYDLHANCYVRKPLRLAEFQEIVKRIEAFWFSIVVLPPQSSVPGAAPTP